MPTEEDALFAQVDALLAGGPTLPPPEERARLREAAGVTQAAVATALDSTVKTVKNWEAGRSEPRPPRLAAYIRLLEGWATRYPAPDAAPAAAGPDAVAVPPTFAPESTATVPAPAPSPEPAVAAPAAPHAPAAEPSGAPTPAVEPAAPTSSATATRSSATSRRPPAPRAARASFDTDHPRGPLAVVDADGTAYCADGTQLTVPARTVPELVEWTLRESGIGAARLHRHGRDADPLIVLTAGAAVRYGLPERLEGFEARQGLRLPADHKVVKQVGKAGWQLTRRGFGPWARIFREVTGGKRQCVQLALLSWSALDARAWAGADQLPAPELARVLGIFAARVITPRGSTAVTGLELMTALRPPTKPERDESAPSGWRSADNPGALHRPVDPAPPEAPSEHPVAQHRPAGVAGALDEEAYQWVRPMDTLTDEECLLPYAVGLDVCTAFLAAAARLTVGLGAPHHLVRPAFDPKTPGCWLVDLSAFEGDPRLPSPFTPSGLRPTGPAWYATPTVAYAVEVGAVVEPLEAWVRRETGAYLDPWYTRLKAAYVATMADLGVTADLDPHAFLTAMEEHKEVDPALACVLAAIKSTVKGGLGKLRERSQEMAYRPGERWPALERPTWRPDIRAAVVAKARVNMHRKMATMARTTGCYPIAVLSDCVVYPSAGPSPLDVIPFGEDGKPLPGVFRLGAVPGSVKHEGTQSMAWAVDLMESEHLNPARHIKDGHDAVINGGE